SSTSNKLLPIQVKDSSGAGYLEHIVQISAGNTHPLAVDENGAAWAWGSNSSGQLGDNTTVSKYVPTQIVDSIGTGHLSDVVYLDGGSGHSLALKADGTVWAWGSNSNGGQLGDGTTSARLV